MLLFHNYFPHKVVFKEQPSTPSGDQSSKKMKENLGDDLVRKILVKEEHVGDSSGRKAAFKEKSRRRKSFHGTIMEEDSQSKLQVSKPQRRRPSCVGLVNYLNKDVLDSPKLTFKNTSKDPLTNVMEGSLAKQDFVVKRLPDDTEITFKESVETGRLSSLVSNRGGKRKTDEDHNGTSKRARSDVNILMNNRSSTPKLVQPFRPPLKTIASPVSLMSGTSEPGPP